MSAYDRLMGGDGDAGFGASKSRLACSVAFSWLAWVLCIAQVGVWHCVESSCFYQAPQWSDPRVPPYCVCTAGN